MVKIDLKDAYLMILVAREHHCPGTASRMDTVSVSPIWTLHCTLCVHKGNQANCPISVIVGNPPDYLSG